MTRDNIIIDRMEFILIFVSKCENYKILLVGNIKLNVKKVVVIFTICFNLLIDIVSVKFLQD